MSPLPPTGEKRSAGRPPNKKDDQRRERDSAQQPANPQFRSAVVFELHIARAMAPRLKPHQPEAVGLDLAGDAVGFGMPAGMMGNNLHRDSLARPRSRCASDSRLPIGTAPPEAIGPSRAAPYFSTFPVSRGPEGARRTKADTG